MTSESVWAATSVWIHALPDATPHILCMCSVSAISKTRLLPRDDIATT